MLRQSKFQESTHSGIKKGIPAITVALDIFELNAERRSALEKTILAIIAQLKTSDLTASKYLQLLCYKKIFAEDSEAKMATLKSPGCQIDGCLNYLLDDSRSWVRTIEKPIESLEANLRGIQ